MTRVRGGDRNAATVAGLRWRGEGRRASAGTERMSTERMGAAKRHRALIPPRGAGENISSFCPFGVAPLILPSWCRPGAGLLTGPERHRHVG